MYAIKFEKKHLVPLKTFLETGRFRTKKANRAQLRLKIPTINCPVYQSKKKLITAVCELEWFENFVGSLKGCNFFALFLLLAACFSLQEMMGTRYCWRCMKRQLTFG